MVRMLSLIVLCPFVFFAVTSAQNDMCARPVLAANVEIGNPQDVFSPGAEVKLSCSQGYSPLFGPRTIVCTSSGEWTRTKFTCIPKRCPSPDLLEHGESYFEDTVYQSTINYTCNKGYMLTGAETNLCLANGTWKTPVPQCQPVTCGLAPIPQFGMMIYDRMIRENTTNYGDRGTYRCLPPYVLIGEARAECTVSGQWTKTPECRVVTCPPPQNIDRGYMSVNDDRDFDYQETIKYGCIGDYMLDGNLQSVCQADGTWSEKPTCMAPCKVGIDRGRILYKGRKYWIGDFDPNKVLHKEIVSFYCKDKARDCSYDVPAQCINGILRIPECYEKPSWNNYYVATGSLPSKIDEC